MAMNKNVKPFAAAILISHFDLTIQHSRKSGDDTRDNKLNIFASVTLSHKVQ